MWQGYECNKAVSKECAMTYLDVSEFKIACYIVGLEATTDS